MRKVDVVAAVLLVIGGVNWGLVGLFRIDLVQDAFGSFPVLVSAVYTLVGLAAVYQAAGLPWIQRRWNVTPRLVQAK